MAAKSILIIRGFEEISLIIHLILYLVHDLVQATRIIRFHVGVLIHQAVWIVHGVLFRMNFAGLPKV